MRFGFAIARARSPWRRVIQPLGVRATRRCQQTPPGANDSIRHGFQLKHYLTLPTGRPNHLNSKVLAKAFPRISLRWPRCIQPASALNPRRALTQYTRTVWTQEHGLPQDTVRAIAQTKDGYLWLGTDEGLAQFDGYDFVVFNKENGALPSNSVGALWAAKDGSLWIGTLGGLTRYRNGKFTTFTKKDGLSDRRSAPSRKTRRAPSGWWPAST